MELPIDLETIFLFYPEKYLPYGNLFNANMLSEEKIRVSIVKNIKFGIGLKVSQP